METQLVLPTLNTEELAKKAQEAAMKGALKTIEDYYNDWNSPYTKAIKEHLNKQPIAGQFNLPDIIAVINDSLSKEIDAIANEAVAKTFLPMVKSFLVRAPKEVKFSEILSEFIECVGAKDVEDCSVIIKEHDKKWWLDVQLSFYDEYESKEYSLTLHSDHEAERQGLKRYKILSLPWRNEQRQQVMKLNMGDKTILELPFTGNVLQDKFISSVARWVIAGSIITVDSDEFSEDMFPEKCHC